MVTWRLVLWRHARFPTGLIPGFHVNNVALILLALSPALLDLGIPLASVAAIIVSTGTVHTFLNYIPSALIGAPDGDTALSLLPGHRMLLSGNAARGVAWSARGSQLGLFLSLPLIVVARIAFGPELGWYDNLRSVLPFVLLTISFLLLATETTRLDWPMWMQKFTGGRLGRDSRFAGFLAATAFFLLAGLYGWGVFTLPARSPIGMPDASLLLPSSPDCSDRQPLGHLRHDLTPSSATRKLGLATGTTARGAVFLVKCCRSVHGRASRHDSLPSHGVGDGWSEPRRQSTRKARVWHGLGGASSHGTQR